MHKIDKRPLLFFDAEPEPEQAKKYKEYGIKIINSLIDNYLTKVGEDDTRPPGMLSHQCYVKHMSNSHSGEQIWVRLT